MVSKIGAVSLFALISTAGLRADFSYQQKSQITGGAMAGMMKVVGVFSKQAREPMQATVAVKGDRMAHWSSTNASIIDLGKETITSIDMQRKTWSVMTFAEMKQAIEKMSQRMAENKDQGEMNFKVSVTPTGQTRQIAGLDTKEVIMKLEMEGTDKKSGQKGAMVITTNMWLAPKAAGYQEMTDFHRRMAEKLNWSPNSSLLMGQPGMAKGMAEVAKEAGKLDGMPVYQVVKMGAEGQAPPSESGSAPPAGSQPQAQAQPEKPSVGSVLGGRLGRFGGLGRKKNEPKQEEPPAQQQPPAARGDASGVLLEMTTETSGFSSAPVDSSRFEVPAGFKQVESEMKKMR